MPRHVKNLQFRNFKSSKASLIYFRQLSLSHWEIFRTSYYNTLENPLLIANLIIYQQKYSLHKRKKNSACQKNVANNLRDSVFTTQTNLLKR